MLRELRAAERARVPDRELGDMRQALADGFDVPWSVVEGGPSALAQVAGDYLRRAGEYGRAGRLSGSSAHARELVALVRVTSPKAGRIDVELAASSGYRRYDRLALARVRAVVASEEGAAALRKHPRTVWAFVTRFEIVPPVPGVGCPLEALFRLDLGRCVYPLKKLPPTSRVEIRGVE